MPNTAFSFVRITPTSASLPAPMSARIVEPARGERALAKEWRTSRERLKFSREAVHEGDKLDKWFRRSTDRSWRDLPETHRSKFADEIWSLVETELKYEGYIARQEDQIARAAKMDARPLPEDLDYTGSPESEKGGAGQAQFAIRPATLGQAGRISGVTPADISVLSIWLEKRRRQEAGASVEGQVPRE